VKLKTALLVAIPLSLAASASADAATLSITTAPEAVPSGGGAIAVTETGQADRDGQLIVYYQEASRRCQRTSEDERQGPTAQGAIGRTLNSRLNIGAGESFQESADFTAQAGTSYRVCGYLAGYDDTVPPDVLADRLVCAVGTHASGNACVSDTGGGTTGSPRLKIKAPSRASGRFTATLTWTARPSDHSVFFYAQPRAIRCYRSGENERNHGYRKIRTLFTSAFNTPGVRTRRVSVREARGGKTRLCAYLYGFNDLGLPHAVVSTVVG
jgi:hypothetical protein